MRSLSSVNNKRIAIVGLGLTGQSCVRFLLGLQARWNLEICAMDTREAIQFESSIPVSVGRLDVQMLQQADIIVVSPGISIHTPEIAEQAQQGKLIIGDIELFAWYYNAHIGLQGSKKLLTVTGSNGKSTVVTMLRDMVEAAGYSAALGGNIGTPALDLFEQEADVYILELSSFQLETTASLLADVACVLNVSEDHMDRYPDFAAYIEAKRRIYVNAKHAVCNLDDANTIPVNAPGITTFGIHPQSKGFGLNSEKTAIQLDEADFISISQLPSLGIHNLLNVQAAAAMALQIGLPKNAIEMAAEKFVGLPHRCQKVADRQGVVWINDSKATNVGATLAAISGLRPVIEGQLILLAGGDSKQADLEPLRECFEQDVDRLYLFGKDAELLENLKPDAEIVANLNVAVSKAADIARPGDTVLLSPACASLDMFQNYIHRGQCFIEAVEALA